MMNVFQLASNDQSIYYLGQIFGNVGVALAGSGPALLSNMFKTFNTVLLTIGAVFVVYITVVGVISTAHEGEFMGKKWNSVWVPLRTIMGIAALFPTASGYCAIQVVMMWLIVQGVGAADSVWSTTINYVGQGGNVRGAGPTVTGNVQADITAQNVVPDEQGAGATTVPSTIKKIFGAIVCQAALVKFASNDPNAVAHSKFDANFSTYYFGRPGDDYQACGSLLIAGSTEGAQKAALAAMNTLVPVMESIANKYVNMVIEDPKCWEQCVAGLDCSYFGKYKRMLSKSDMPSSCPIVSSDAWSDILSYAGSNFMSDATQMLAGYANNYVINQRVENKEKGKTSNTEDNPMDVGAALERARVNGWIFAGAYYYSIASGSNATLGSFTEFYKSFVTSNLNLSNAFRSGVSMSPITVYPIQQFYCGFPDNPGDGCKVGTADAPGGGGLGLVDRAVAAMQGAQETGGGITVDGGGGGDLGAFSEMGDVPKSTISTWMTNLAGQKNSMKDPIANIQYFGKSLLVGAEVMFWIGLAAAMIAGAVASPFVALGNTPFSVPGGVALGVMLYIIPVVFFVIAYMATMGALLGVYVPLIPYIFFTFGAIGWFIAVIEAMVAAPVVALGILSPGGQHELLGRAEPAAMIILNVVLRPVLMIFGMMTAMLLGFIVIKMINGAFLAVVASINHGGMGLLEAFIFIMAYAGLVITALNKCFALIYLLPDKVLRWIGGQAESHGEAEAAEAVKGKVSAGGEVGSRAIGGMSSKGTSEAQRTQKVQEGKFRESGKKGLGARTDADK